MSAVRGAHYNNQFITQIHLSKSVLWVSLTVVLDFLCQVYQTQEESADSFMKNQHHKFTYKRHTYLEVKD